MRSGGHDLIDRGRFAAFPDLTQQPNFRERPERVVGAPSIPVVVDQEERHMISADRTNDRCRITVGDARGKPPGEPGHVGWVPRHDGACGKRLLRDPGTGCVKIRLSLPLGVRSLGDDGINRIRQARHQNESRGPDVRSSEPHQTQQDTSPFNRSHQEERNQRDQEPPRFGERPNQQEGQRRQRNQSTQAAPG